MINIDSNSYSQSKDGHMSHVFYPNRPIKGDRSRGKGHMLWAEDVCQEALDASAAALRAGFPMQIEVALNQRTRTGLYIIDEALDKGPRSEEFAFWGKIEVEGIWFYLVSKPPRKSSEVVTL